MQRAVGREGDGVRDEGASRGEEAELDGRVAAVDDVVGLAVGGVSMRKAEAASSDLLFGQCRPDKVHLMREVREGNRHIQLIHNASVAADVVFMHVHLFQALPQKG